MNSPSTPINFYTQQANRQVLLTWAITSGATGYVVQRSLDGVNFVTIDSPANPKYLDVNVDVGTAYWYKVAATNSSGTSNYTNPQSIVPTPTGEMSLGELRTRAQNRADRLNSDFVDMPEWNFFINQAMFELYDLLVTTYQDLYVCTPATFQVNGADYLYPLPNGLNTYINGVSGVTGYVAPPFYKLIGVDLALNSSANGWVTVSRFNFSDRNKFIYPNSASTIYGVFNLQYRLVGSNIEFIPTPSGGQQIRIWYIPRLNELLSDTDITTTGISGWLQYVIVRAAKYALDKEESDTAKLDEELTFLKKRIEESAANQDAGMPDKISDVRSSNAGGVSGSWEGFKGGW